MRWSLFLTTIVSSTMSMKLSTWLVGNVGHVVMINSTHKYNTVTRYRNEDKRQQYSFYRTRQWSHLRQQVLERDHYLCAYCKVQGVITPAKTVDHIVPIEFDETLKANIANLAVICGSCHRAKTDWEQLTYGTGQGNELKSVTPINDISSIVVLMSN